MSVDKNARRALIIAAVLTLVLPSIPLAGVLLRPFVWLQTFAHEFGHGFTALVLGGGLFTITIFSDGSGVTHHPGALADVPSALVSIGGLVGPAFGAALFFVFARRQMLARVGLVALGLLALACAVVVMSNVFGRVVVGVWGVVLLALGARLSASSAQVAAAFAGVNLGLSVFSRGDYLFTATAKTGEGDMPSDVAHVAEHLGGFYLVWGAAIGLFSIAVVAAGLALLLRSSTSSAPAPAPAPAAR